MGVNKYHNIKTVFGQRTYASRAEANYAAELNMRIRANDIKGWEAQVPVEMVVQGVKICKYIIDFVITHTDGSLEYVEVKGFEKPEWKLKWKLFEALYPDLKKTIIKN